MVVILRLLDAHVTSDRVDGEIALIEVIADDERLKRHSLEVRRHGSVPADPCNADRHCRQRVEPAERMGGSFYLLGSENELLLAVPTSPAVIAVAVRGYLPVGEHAVAAVGSRQQIVAEVRVGEVAGVDRNPVLRPSREAGQQNHQKK